MFQTQHPTVEWQRKKEKCFHYVKGTAILIPEQTTV